MRILLINPVIPNRSLLFDYAENNEEALTTREMDGPPFALNHLAGMLNDEDVRILDLRALNDRNFNFDMEQELFKTLRDFDPEIVGLSCMMAQVNPARDIFRCLLDYNSDILTIVGGIHPTACPEDFPDAKLIVMGLGKRTLRSIVDEYKKNKKNADFSDIPGLAQNINGKLYFSKQLSSLAYKEIVNDHLCQEYSPNRKLTDEYDYRIKDNSKIHYVSTSFGCPGRCNFCYLWQFMNGKYLHRDVDSIIKEMKTMDQYHVIRLCDAHSFGHPGKANDLFKKILDENIQHDFVADVRADFVVRNPEVIKTAVKAGLKVAIIGLEATTDEDLQKLGKNSTIQITTQALKFLNELGVWVSGNYIVDCDADERQFDNMAQFVMNHPIFFSGFTILTPFPGTKLYDQLKDKIIINNPDYYNLTNAVLKTRLSEKKFYTKVNDLYKIGIDARKKFFSIYGTPNFAKVDKKNNKEDKYVL